MANRLSPTSVSPHVCPRAVLLTVPTRSTGEGGSRPGWGDGAPEGAAGSARLLDRKSPRVLLLKQRKGNQMANAKSNTFTTTYSARTATAVRSALQAVPGRGSHPGLFSMGLAIMVCCGSVGTGENTCDVFDIKLITVDKGF